MSNPYDYLIDPEGNATANKVLRLVGHGRRVLELGTAAGVMTRELQAQGCSVVGVESVEEMAQKAAQWCERMIVGDLEVMDFDREFAGEQPFDVIVAADVLEHLRDPAAVLKRLSGFLAKEGHIVISVPNIAYMGLIAGLVGGRFQYRVKGLLDRTHLRFFTRQDIEWLLLGSGWLPSRWDAYHVPVTASEFFTDWSSLEPSLRHRLERAADSDVYQYILTAVPAHDEGYAYRYKDQIESLEQVLHAERAGHRDRIAAHEQDLGALREHQEAFAEARKLLAAGEALKAQHEELKGQHEALKGQHEELKGQHEELKVKHKQLYLQVHPISQFRRIVRRIRSRMAHLLRGFARRVDSGG